MPGGKAIALKAGLSDVNQVGSSIFLERCYDNDSGDFRLTNYLDIYKDLRMIGLLNGKNGGFWNHEEWVQFANYTLEGRSIPGMPSDAAAATEGAARTNPSRPRVDIVQFIAELKDVPKMIFQIGDLLSRMAKAQKLGNRFKPTAKDFADGYLGWTFGWDPLLSDLRKLFDFEKMVDDRLKELEQLRNGRLSRTVKVFSTSFEEEWAYGYVGSLYQAQARGTLRSLITADKWVSVRYRPTDPSILPMGADLRNLARSLVFGHNLDPSTVWELMPWSWLIDWFSTTGDYFAANRNHLKTVIEDIAVMTHLTATPTTWTWVSNPYGAEFTVLKGSTASWKRRRRVAGPSITATVPFLNPKQWSILSSLAVSRFKR